MKSHVIDLDYRIDTDDSHPQMVRLLSIDVPCNHTDRKLSDFTDTELLTEVWRRLVGREPDAVHP